MIRKTTLLLLMIIVAVRSMAQPSRLSYKESDEDFANPERGFYIPMGTKVSNFILLDPGHLLDYRNQQQQLKGARYKINVSLIYRAYELDTFRHQALSNAFLINLQKDFDAVRTAGLKMILRFATLCDLSN